MAMKINGQRLREARAFRGLTITQLAEKVGVSKQMISRYEHDRSNISLETFMKIIKELHFPMNFFTGEVKFVYTNEGTFYRSRLTSTQIEKKPSETYKQAAAILRDYFEQYIDFPMLDLIDEVDSPEEAAYKLRNLWQLGSLPIDNMVEVLESHGITVVNTNMEAKKVDAVGGYAKINRNRYYVVINNFTEGSYYRTQFSLAHELGHYIYHANPDSDNIAEYREMEKEADRFASSFLLPHDAFMETLKSIDVMDLNAYVPLKEQWNVSIAAMLLRARKLRVIDDNQYQRLQKSISYHRWRKHEPGDDKKPAMPTMLHDSFRLMQQHMNITASELSQKIAEEYGYDYPKELLACLLGIDISEFNEKGSLLKFRVDD